MKRDRNLRERSPRIQEIMGKIPPWVVRWGMSVVFVVLLMMVFVSWIIKYPEKVIVNLKIERSFKSGAYTGVGFVREVDFIKIKEGMRVKIKLSGYPYREYGILEGEEEDKDYIEGKGFRVRIKLGNRLITNFGKRIEYYKGMNGTGEIIVKEERLFNKFVKRFGGKN